MKVECKLCRREVPQEYVRSRIVGGFVTDAAWCVHCEGDRNREINDRTSNLIRELKDEPTSTRQAEIMRDLTSLSHPDVQGLVKAIEEKRNAPKQPQRRRA